MGNYRGVVRHVRWWRGEVHRWSTSYQFSGALSKPIDAAACAALQLADDKMCYSLNAMNGGTYECEIYNMSVKGPPLATNTTFDWTTPASWLAYNGAAWSVTTGYQWEESAEPALAVEWAGGISSSGKKVIFRKWYHAIPTSRGAYGAVDVVAANVTSLQAQANAITGCLGSYGISLGSKSGRLAGSATVLPFYGAHQMPKGRRRKALVSASGVYHGPQLTLPPGIQEGETD